MGGTPAGGKKLKQTLIAKLGGVEAYRAFMSEVGTKGGKAVHTKPRGFAAMPRERVSEYGKQGGAMSKRKARNG